MRALRKVGVPYPAGMKMARPKRAAAQRQKIVANLAVGMVNAPPDREIIALIAYLQRLGTDIKAAPPPLPRPPPPRRSLTKLKSPMIQKCHPTSGRN